MGIYWSVFVKLAQIIETWKIDDYFYWMPMR